MMTRKDYQLIADTIMQVRNSYGTNWDPNLFRACDDMSRAFAAVLREDNPRFDREKFMQAAGFQTKGDRP